MSNQPDRPAERAAAFGTTSTAPAALMLQLEQLLSQETVANAEGSPTSGEVALGRRVLARLVILNGEVYRLPTEARALSVIAGKAWVTGGGKDLVLKPGERTALRLEDDFALVSSLGRTPLILEVLGCRARHIAMTKT